MRPVHRGVVAGRAFTKPVAQPTKTRLALRPGASSSDRIGKAPPAFRVTTPPHSAASGSAMR